MSLLLRKIEIGICLSCLLGLSGCTTSHTQNTPVQESDETYPKSSTAPSVGSQATGQNTTPTASGSAIELLEIARQQAEAGQGDKAAATLERAIHIEPDNPWLWHRLAVLRMQQKKWPQAVELANRSIALANGNRRLIGGNWLVISLSLEGAGQYEAAAKAKRNSDEYLEK